MQCQAVNDITTANDQPGLCRSPKQQPRKSLQEPNPACAQHKSQLLFATTSRPLRTSSLHRSAHRTTQSKCNQLKARCEFPCAMTPSPATITAPTAKSTQDDSTRHAAGYKIKHWLLATLTKQRQNPLAADRCRYAGVQRSGLQRASVASAVNFASSASKRIGNACVGSVAIVSVAEHALLAWPEMVSQTARQT